MQPLHFLASLAAVLLPGLAPAQSITWGSTVGQELRDSENHKLGEGWQFELGVFLPGFYPTASNIEDWVSHWVTLDRAKYNAGAGFFSSRAPATAVQTAGLQAYIWVYNKREYHADAEWLLITDRDGKLSNDWVIPNQSSDPAAAIVDWRVSRATTVLMGKASQVAEISPRGGGGAKFKRTAYSTRPIPGPALLAAARKSDLETPTATLAGGVAEEFVEGD